MNCISLYDEKQDHYLVTTVEFDAIKDKFTVTTWRRQKDEPACAS